MTEQLLSTCQYRFSPLQSKVTVETIIKRDDGASCRPIGNNQLLLWDGTSSIVYTINDRKDFLSEVGRDSSINVLNQQIAKYTQLSAVQSMEIMYSEPGTNIISDLAINPSVFVATNKTSTYFDFVVYVVKNNALIGCFTYNSRSNNSIPGVLHSGDIGALLQTITFTNVDESCYFCLCVVGYRKNLLKTYVNQQPSVCVVCDNVVQVIPCSLEEVLMGNSTLSCLAVSKKINNKMVYHVLREQVNLQDVDVGDVSPNTHNCMVNIVKDIIIVNRSQSEASERYLSGILYYLNNHIFHSL
jgi:hypothetical protein